jgi:hypothetical protein
MNNLYTPNIIAVCSIIIIKLFYENKKLKSKLFNNEDQLVDENINHTESVNPFLIVQDISSDNKKINPETASKNAFLHCDDNFGTMEKGVVLENNTYIDEKGNKSGDFEIQAIIKKRRNKKS